MAKEKLSPRQKMINLMYLVFISMLAMQIDQEIIRSYFDTNASLEESRRLTEQKNDKIFEETLKAKAENNEASAVYYQNYLELKGKINDLVSFIDGIKSDLKKDAGYEFEKNIDKNFSALNNTEASTKKFFESGDEDSPSKIAQDLKVKIENLRSFINKTFGKNQDLKSVVDRANVRLITDKKNGKDWLVYSFYNQPLVAALSNLEVVQSEVRNLQSDALALMLREQVDADIQFNAYEAFVAGPTVVVQGQPVEAKVFIGTYSNDPNISFMGVDRVSNGMGVKSLSGSGVGEHTFSGTVSYKNAKGEMVALPFKHNYTVIAGTQEVKLQSGALVSADKMNVLYRGVENPISASMLGVDNSTVTLTASGASISGGKGKWIVRPGAGNIVNITISGKQPNGKAVSETFPFRVKSVPAPQGQIRNQNVVSMPASSIANQVVSCAIPDFDFPVSFQVTGFSFKVPGKAATYVSGNSMKSVEALTKNLRAGDICYVFGIQATATGLGGQMLKNISPIVINVQ